MSIDQKKIRARRRRYDQSEKGQARHARYNDSEKGQQRRWRYEESEWGASVRSDYEMRFGLIDRNRRRSFEAAERDAARIDTLEDEFLANFGEAFGDFMRRVIGREWETPQARQAELDLRKSRPWPNGKPGSEERKRKLAEHMAFRARRWEMHCWQRDGLAYWRKEGTGLRFVVAPEKVWL